MMIAPLQVYSSYSLLQSPIKIDQLVEAAVKRGYQTIVLTDIDNLYGSADFYLAAKKNNLIPVIGLTIIFENQPTVFLAKNQTGYKQLIKLSSKKMTGQFENFDQLLKDLDLSQLIIISNFKQLSNLVADFYTIDQAGLTTVKFLNPEDHYLLEILSAIDNNQKISINKINFESSSTNYLEDFKDYRDKLTPEQLAIQTEIFDKISDFKINFSDQVELPKFDETLDSNQYLWDLIQKGIAARLANKKVDFQIYQERLKFEFQVISQLNFTDYFLIVWDILNYAHHNNIQTGPGRGSAAGSLIAYALYITEIDPIEFGLLFERFLNSERIQLPDIDIDVPDIDRQKIIKYIIDKYGEVKTAQIITFSTLSGRQAIRDVARIFNADNQSLKLLSNLFDNQINNFKDLDQAKIVKQLELIENGTQIFEVAEKIEGLPRQFSVHAAGIVLSATDLTETIPVQKGAENLLTQVTKKYVEKFGLLKIDILGLKNLTLLSNILSLINQDTGKKININKIDLNDQATINIFKNADTDYIFQFESSGIREFLKRVDVNNFNQIVDVNAMYRPGPMRNIDSYIQRKNGQAKVDYFDARLKPILEPTFGIIIYQEQAMLIAETMAGFTLGQADILRAAISKKNSGQMQQLKKDFINGAIANDFDQRVADQVFDFIEQFAGYGFNRSHAVAYSSMSFSLAYLKTHYPLYFFTAVLMQELGNQDKIKSISVMMQRFDVQLTLPNINTSNLNFSISNHSIVYGLLGIKKIRSDLAKEIVNQRNANGEYTSLQDFIARLDPKFLKFEPLESLALSGALDNLGYNRHEIIENIDRLISGAELGKEILKSTNLNKYDEFSKMQLISYENDYLGISLSGSPLEQYSQLAKQQAVTQYSQLKVGIEEKILVMVTGVKVIKTKNDQEMAFLTVNDDFGEFSVTVFPQNYQKYFEQIKVGTVAIIVGELQKRNNELNLIANDFKKVGDLSDNDKNSILKSE